MEARPTKTSISYFFVCNLYVPIVIAHRTRRYWSGILAAIQALRWSAHMTNTSERCTMWRWFSRIVWAVLYWRCSGLLDGYSVTRWYKQRWFPSNASLSSKLSNVIIRFHWKVIILYQHNLENKKWPEKSSQIDIYNNIEVCACACEHVLKLQAIGIFSVQYMCCCVGAISNFESVCGHERKRAKNVSHSSRKSISYTEIDEQKDRALSFS